MATNPYVVGNGTKEVVACVDVEYSSKAILEIITPAWLECNTIYVKPSTPEGSCEEIDMSVDQPTRVVTEAEVYLRLCVEVYHTEDTLWRKQRWQRVNDRVVIGLSIVSSDLTMISVKPTIMDKLYDMVIRSAPPYSGRW